MTSLSLNKLFDLLNYRCSTSLGGQINKHLKFHLTPRYKEFSDSINVDLFTDIPVAHINITICLVLIGIWQAFPQKTAYILLLLGYYS